MAESGKQQSFWATLPGLLTALAGLIVAITGLIAALSAAGLITVRGVSPSPSPSPGPTAVSTVVGQPNPSSAPTAASTVAIYRCSITEATGAFILRSGPGEQFPQVEVLRPGQMVTVHGWTKPIGQTGVPWFQVTTPANKQGYIISRASGTPDLACNFEVAGPSFPFPERSP